MTEIDGLDIHFIHVRSKHENALPLIVTHGWPGSVIEQLKIIDPLTNPTSHGGSASAFDSLDMFYKKSRAYAAIMGTRPQMIGYALADSPFFWRPRRRPARSLFRWPLRYFRRRSIEPRRHGPGVPIAT
jgi:Epoxide hydrolase N terminus